MNIYDSKNFKWDMNLVYIVDNYYTIKISIKSDMFIGSYNFCVTKDDIEHVLNEINDQLFTNEIVLRDRDSKHILTCRVKLASIHMMA